MGKDRICLNCGHMNTMVMRHGVWMSPRCAIVFDMIERSGERGVPPQVLRDLFFVGSWVGVKIFVRLINGALESTDLRVGMRVRPYASYRLKRKS
jgi:hypothetical protein